MRKISFSSAIKEAIDQSMTMDKNVITFGLGVSTSSNIYGTTTGLKEKFGEQRVFDTPAAESALTAMATGMALDGKRPLLIHQRFDFMIYSLDQIVNWISLWSYKSGGKSQLPLTIRTIVGKGWGQGPQHSKSLHSWFSNLPGLSVVFPSSPYEAKGLMLSSIFSNFPTIFFESRSLHSMEEEVPEKPYFLNPTKSFIRRKGKDITLVGIGSTVKNCLEVAKTLENTKNIKCDVLDLRSLNPLDEKTILNSLIKTKSLCVVEDGFPNASIADNIISLVTSNVKLKDKPIKICWPKSFVPTTHHLEKEYYITNDKILNKILNGRK